MVDRLDLDPLAGGERDGGDKGGNDTEHAVPPLSGGRSPTRY